MPNLLKNDPETLVKNLNKIIPGLLQKFKVPGLSISLIQEAQIFCSLSYGLINSSRTKPVTTQTIFEAASLSKPLFALAALKLSEKGLVELDTPLYSYLPEPYLPEEPLADRITMRQVLSHMTGFPNWRPDGEALKVFFKPGERFSYSGEGFVYLQTVLEYLLSQPLEEYLQQNLLLPLGMHKSSFIWQQKDNEDIAYGHDEHAKPREIRLWPKINSAASLHTTSTDYARFICSILDPAKNQPASLNPQLQKMMLTRQVPVNDSTSWHKDWPREKIRTNDRVGWGLGWGIQNSGDGESFWQWGDNTWYQAYACGFQEQKNGLVILTNGKNGQKLIRHILKNIIGIEAPGLEWQDQLHEYQKIQSK